MQSEPHPYRVLVCDDQPDVLEALRLLLKGQGWQAVTADSPQRLLETVRTGGAFDLILTDLNYTRDTTSGQEGMDLLASLEAQGNTVPVVVMTAWGNVDLAVEAMRRGACDFVQKPWDNNRLLATIRKQAEPVRKRKSELEIAANVQQKLFPRKLRRLDIARLCGPLHAGARSGRRLLRFLGTAGPWNRLRAGRCLGQRRSRGAADGQPAGVLPQPAAARAAASRRGAAQRSTATSSSPPRRNASPRWCSPPTTTVTRQIRYVNCAHCAPLLLRAGGHLEMLDSTATMLGAFDQWTCVENVTTLEPGDTLLLYSDGVTEAGADCGEEFGEERLIHALRANQSLPAEALVQAIVDDVNEFSGAARSDDVTVVALRGL